MLDALVVQSTVQVDYLTTVMYYCAYYMERFKWEAPIHFHFKLLQMAPTASIKDIEQKRDELEAAWENSREVGGSQPSDEDDYKVMCKSLRAIESFVQGNLQTRNK